MRSKTMVRWFAVTGVTAVAALALCMASASVSAKDGKTKTAPQSTSPVTDSSSPSEAHVTKPGVPHNRGYRVLPPITVDYRNDGMSVINNQHQVAIGGGAPSNLLGSTANKSDKLSPGDPCRIDAECDDCNPCTLDGCELSTCSSGPLTGLPCDSDVDCEGTCVGGGANGLSCTSVLDCCGGTPARVCTSGSDRAGNECETDANCRSKTCTGGNCPGATCESDMDCVGGTCDGGTGSCVDNTPMVCTAGDVGAGCTVGSECDTFGCDGDIGFDCTVNGDCVGHGGTQTCISRSDGTCSVNGDFTTDITDGDCVLNTCTALPFRQCVSGLIPACRVDARGECYDGELCNGLETCSAGACVAGTPANCPAGTVCEDVQGGAVCRAACITDEECEIDGLVCTVDKCDFKRCVGGSNPNAICASDGDCSGGTCTGGGTGLCYVDENPCGPGGACAEQRVCVGGFTPGHVCTTDVQCGGGAVCPTTLICAGGANAGMQCAGDGDCPGSSCQGIVPSCDPGRCCDGSGTCSIDTYADCTSGLWLASNTACQLADPANPDSLDSCPSYSAGLAPQGDFTVEFGPVVAAGNCAGSITSAGDDYKIGDGSGFSEMRFLRFAAHVDVAVRFQVSIYNSAGVKVEDIFVPDGQNAAASDDPVIFTVNYEPPLIIPNMGYIVVEVQQDFGAFGRFNLVATDAVDVGASDPDLMWYNGPTSGNTLGQCTGGDRDGLWCDVNNGNADCTGGGTCVDIPDDFAFEMVVSAFSGTPDGACCDSNIGTCTQQLEWDCNAGGDSFQGVGSQCQACSNDLTIACTDVSDCPPLACEGGPLDGLSCTSDIECDPGTCTGTPVCQPVFPACTIQGCCDNPGGGDCTEAALQCVNAPPGPAIGCLVDADCPVGTGPCLNQFGLTTCPVGATSLGYGSVCTPNRCIQPVSSGGDTCEEAAANNPLIFDVASAPQGTVLSQTATGNNSTATYDDWQEGECVGGANDGDPCDPEGDGSECATPGECTRKCAQARFNPDGTTQDPGWWETFHINACADVRIDLCTSNPVVRPAWAGIIGGCPCAFGVATIGVPEPIGEGYGTEGSARGPSFCDPDDNLWQTFGPLAPGDYYYPIYSAPNGTASAPPGVTYQFHVTVSPCKEAACCASLCSGGARDGQVCNPEPTTCTCVGGSCSGGALDGFACDTGTGIVDWCPSGTCPADQSTYGCDETNELICTTANGFWHQGGNYPLAVCDSPGEPDVDGQKCTPGAGECGGGSCVPQTPITSCTGSPCDTGACCAGPGACQDRTIGDQLLTRTDCQDPGETFVGGARCLYEPPPCPVCTVDPDSGDCVRDDSGYFSECDRVNNGAICADDFVPNNSTIDQFCFFPAFRLNDAGAAGFYDCADPDGVFGPPADHMEIRIYTDVNGAPGVLVHELDPAPVTAKSWTGEFAVPQTVTWSYSIVFDPPLGGLVAGNTYWIEFVGSGNANCYMGFSLSTLGNQFSYQEIDSYDDQQEWTFEDQNGIKNDYSFCIGSITSPSISQPPSPTGACCQCDGICQDDIPWYDCLGYVCLDDAPCGPDNVGAQELVDPIYGLAQFFPGQNCIDVGCTDAGDVGGCGGVAVAEEDCTLPLPVGVGTAPGEQFAFTVTNYCSSTDGRATYPVGTCDCALANGGSAPCKFEDDKWYEYSATCTGIVEIDMCGDTDYDSIASIFKFDKNEAITCPPPLSKLQGGACIDTMCPATNAVGEPTTTVFANKGEKILLRIGGEALDGEFDATGTTKVTMRCRSQTCFPTQAPFSQQLQNANNVIVGLAGPRNLTFQDQNPGRQTAVRVRAIDLSNFGPGGNFSVFNGTDFWLQTPFISSNFGSVPLSSPCRVCSAGGEGCTQDADCGLGTCDPASPLPAGCNLSTTFKYANIGDTPVYRDWSLDGTIVIGGELIVPSSAYQVDVIDASCDTALAANYSDPIRQCFGGSNNGKICELNSDCGSGTCETYIVTMRWGDSVELSSGEWRSPANLCSDLVTGCIRDSDCGTGTCGTVSVFDTLHVLAAFAGTGDAKWRSDLRDAEVYEVQDGKITVADTLAILAAYGSENYPGQVPSAKVANHGSTSASQGKR